MAPWPDLTQSIFFLPKNAQGLPHKAVENPAALRAAVFFAIREKPQGGRIDPPACARVNVWPYCTTRQIDMFSQHRQELMRIAKSMVYAPTERALADVLETLKEQWGAVYPRFIDYQETLVDRRQEWALCFRTGLPTRGQNTNNTVEAAMRVLKDNVLHR